MKKPGETGRTQARPAFDHALRASLVSGVILVNPESKVATLTPEASEILGLPKDSEPEQPLERVPAALLKLANEVLLSGKPGSARQVPVDAGSTAELLLASAVPIKAGTTGSIAVLTLHQVNASGEFLQRIQQLDRLANAGTLAAGMAHEIKNALVAGRTFLDLLLEKNSDEELVQIVRRETSRIDAIVSRMLRFAGTNASSLKPLHVHELLEHALRLVQPQMATSSVSLERSLKAARDVIRADEYELHQAFVNLFLNALEAMGQGGKLTITTEVRPASQEEPQIEITIRDTGTGVLPEHADRLFEPFFTTKAAGTGLGLAVTQRIIQEHGGSISVRSEPGQGTTFSVILPLVPEAAGMQLGGFSTAMLGRKQG
ncbi:MAG TPA: ATP-binding protein [Verrucomicrobiae bacterium]|nr:ATP-binding protein [Verrucomicrobiae bacterium]